MRRIPSSRRATVVVGSLAFALFLGTLVPATADPARLVEDLQPGPDARWSRPVSFTPLGPITLFAASTDGHGGELWRSDGTADGTVLVCDIGPGCLGGYSRELTRFGDRVFFAADDGRHGIELWTSDGSTDGTVLLKDIEPGPKKSIPSDLTVFDGRLWFRLGNWPQRKELWVSDGTSEGTRSFADFNIGDYGGGPEALAAAGDSLYIVADHGDQLWRTDGTPDSLDLLLTVPAGPPGAGGPYGIMEWELAAAGGRLFFLAELDSDLELWVSDGTAAGTTAVPGTAGATGRLTAFGDRVAFVRDDGVHGQEPWISDGSAAGTALLKDIDPTGSAGPTSLVVLGDTLYFQADDGVHGDELWRTDGTEAGTVLVRDIDPGSTGGSPHGLCAIGPTLYFQARTPDEGWEPWTSDGTEAGTRLLADIWPGADHSRATRFAEVGAAVWFAADDGASGTELWETDGTSAGTHRISNINSDLSQPAISRPVVADDRRFFASDADGHGSELWVSDATGTRLVRDVRPGEEGSEPAHITLCNGEAWFAADDGTHGRELWRSDGTEAGTSMVADLLAGEFGSDPVWLGVFADALWFVAQGTADWGATGGLWRTDGTPEGTTRLPGFEVSYDDMFDRLGILVRGRSLIFTGRDPDGEPGIFRTDGTVDGTELVATCEPGGAALELTSFRGVLYYNGAHWPGSPSYQTVRALFRTDGTPSGTELVAEKFPLSGSPSDPGAPGPSQLRVLGNRLLFTAYDLAHGWELWTSDGTDPGTEVVRDLYPGETSSDPDELIVLGDRLLFVATSEAEGRELFVSDGTEAGTTCLLDIVVGTVGSLPHDLTPIGRSGRVIFTASDGEAGEEPWITDGTEVGTYRLQDLAPGLESSGASAYSVDRETIWFAADDRVTGRDLWAVDLADLGIPFDLDDLDGDGFTNEAEEAAGTSATDASDTPFGGASTGNPIFLELRRTRIRLRFDKTGRDTVELKGRLPVRGDFVPEGETVIIDLGGVIRVFVLNRKGKGRRADGSRFKLKLDLHRGIARADERAKFVLELPKGDYAGAFADEDLTGGITVSGAPRVMSTTVWYDGRAYRIELDLGYTAKAGRKGKAKDR